MAYAAGVLPIAWVTETQAVFLVGRDARDHSYSDFGGRSEKCDRDIACTASREFWEETLGVFVDAKVVKTRMTPGNCVVLESKTQNGWPYHTFVVEMPLTTHLRSTFAKVLGFMRHRAGVSRMYLEKTDVVWLTLDELLNRDLPKRNVFQATLELHKDALRSMAARGAAGWRDVCAEYAASFPG